MKDQTLTIQEAAKFLGVSTKTLRRWDTSGKLQPERTVGNQRRYSLAALQAFLQTKPVVLPTPAFISAPIQTSEPVAEERAEKAEEIEKPIISFSTAGLAHQVAEESEAAPKMQPTMLPHAPQPEPVGTPEPVQSLAYASQPQQLAFQTSPHYMQTASDKIKGWFAELHQSNTRLAFAGSLGLILLFFALVGLGQSAATGGTFFPEANKNRSVLAAGDVAPQYQLTINVPGIFGKKVSFLDSVSIKKDLVVEGGIDTKNSNINAGTGTVTASNLVYSVLAGSNITVTGDPQNPTISADLSNIEIPEFAGVQSFQGQTGAVALAAGSGIGLNGLSISNTGVLSLQGQTGAVTLTGGSGVSVSGTTIANTDPGSAQNIFKSIITPSTTIDASSNTDSLTFAAGSGITITGDAGSKTVTITSNASGTLAGLNTNGVLYATSANNAASTTAGTSGTVLKGVTAGAPVFGAVNLTSDIAGALGVANGGTGVTATPTNGQVLIGNGTGFSLATITAGSGLGITNGAGTISLTNNGVLSVTGTANQITTSGSTGAITLSLPQNIHTGAAPTFTSMNLSANTNQLVLGTGNTGTITMATLTGGRTYTLPDASGEICLSIGNCPGGGGGTIGGSGTASYLPRFTNATTLGNSLLYDTGSKIGLGTISPEGLFSVSGASTGKALVSLNETGNQNILTGSASGTTRFYFDQSGNLSLNGGGLQFNGVNVLSGTSLGSSITGSSLTSVSTLNAGAISAGFGAIDVGTDAISGGDITSTGTTGITIAGNGAGLTFSGTGNHIVSASSGVLQFGAATLTGAITGNSQSITGLTNLSASGTITFGGLSTGIVKSNGSGVLSSSAVGLGTADVTGTLGVTNGGTGLNSFATGDLIYASGANTLAARSIGTAGQILTVVGGVPTWSDAGGTINFWQRTSGALSPLNINDDLLVGGNATSSARFQVFGTTGNATTSGTLTFSGANSIQTTANQTFTIGGNSTGNITLSPLNGNGTVTSTGDLNLASGKGYQINGANVLTSTALGSSVVSSSLTSVGALTSGSIGSGFGTIATANTITGTTINGTTGINTGAAAGTQRIDSSGNLVNIGTITASGAIRFSSLGAGVVQSDADGDLSSAALNLAGGASYITGTLPVSNGGTGGTSVGSAGSVAYSNGSAYAFSGVGTSGQVLVSGGTGAPTWQDASAIGTNYWQRNAGALSSLNITDDLLIGGASTSSAKMVLSGLTGNASTSGTLTFNTASSIQTTANQTLTIGGNTTGNITLSPLNGTGTVLVNGGLNLSSGNAFAINGTSVLNATTLGSTVTGSSLTSVGALASGSIASGFGSIFTTNTIQGTDITASGTTGFTASGNGAGLTFSGTGNHLISASAGVLQLGATTLTGAITGNSQNVTGVNNLSAGGTITFGGLTTNNGLLYTNGSGVVSQAGAGTDGQILVANGSGVPTFVTVGSDATITNTGTLTIANNAVALTTDTTGNYVLSVTGGNGIGVSGSAGEGWTPSIALGALTADWDQTGAFDIVLNNASSELRILESAGSTYFGTIDIGDLSANQTYTFPDATGTVCLSTGNCAGGSGGSKFQLNGNVIAPLTATNQIVIGGNTATDFFFEVSGARAGKALVSFNETGDQNILTASASGSTVFNVTRAGTLQMLESAGGTFFGTLSVGDLAANKTFVLPNFTGSSADICLSTGNCAGAGGGLTGSGTAGQIAFFNGSGSLNSESAGFAWDATNDRLGIGNDTPTGKLDVTGANLGKSLVILNETGDQDIFTASASGTTRLTLSRSGSLNLIGGAYQSNGVAGITQGTASCVTTTNGIVTGFGTCQLGSEQWEVANGAIYSGNPSLDFLLGGSATASARFAVTNISGGTPTASLSAGLAGGASLAANGILQTTNMQSLTLGSASTGTIIIDAGNGLVRLADYTTNGGLLYTNASGTIGQTTAGTSGQVLISNGGGAPTWMDASAIGTNYWQRNAGALSSLNIADDLLVGSNATSSALFSISGTTGNASTSGTLTFNTTGNIQTTNNQTLTIGGTSTGNITLSPLNGNGTVTSTGDLNLVSGKGYQINGANVLTSTALGSSVVSSSLTSVGALTSGSIGSGFGTIATANTITGTTINGTTGINTGAGAGTLRIDNTGNLSNIGTINASGTITFGSLGTGVVQSNGSGVLSSAALNLAGGTSYITGILPAANGGTGDDTSGTTGVPYISSGNWSYEAQLSSTRGGTGANLSGANQGAIPYFSSTGVMSALGPGTAGYVLTTNGAGQNPTWTDAASLGTNYWQRNAGTLSPLNITDDLLVGGTATSSARFQVFGMTGNATTSGTLTFSTASSIQTTANQTLTIGGNTTGNITLSPLNGNGTVTSTGDLNLASGKGYQINGANVLTSTALGSSVIGSSLTSVGALTGGSIASGFGTIATANTITGTTINGTTGINTGASAGTQRIDSSGNLVNIGTIDSTYLDATGNNVNLAASTALQFNGTTVLNASRQLENIAGVGTNLNPTANNTYSLGASGNQYSSVYGQALYQNGNQVCDTSGNCSGLTVTYWNQNNGAISAKNSTVDLLVGGTSTESAKFAVLNVNPGSGTPTASVSAGTTGAAYLTAAGTLQTTANQTLTIGGNTTGNITLSPLNGAGTVTSTGNLSLATGKAYQINGVDVLTSAALGSGITGSSLTQVGALSSGSIASGFGTIATANTITGTTINGTTGINTGAGAGTLRIDNNGNLSNIGTINASGAITLSNLGAGIVKSTAGGLLSSAALNLASGTEVTGTLAAGNGGTGFNTYTTGDLLVGNGSSTLSKLAVGAEGSILSISGGTPAWIAGSSINYWQRANGALAPLNITDDLLLGATASNSAKFAFRNVAGGTPTASISANSGNNALYLQGDGTIAATNMQRLNFGSASTGGFNFQSGVESTSAFNFRTAAGNNAFTIDSINGRYGFNLGGSSIPTLADQGVEIRGALRLSGDGTTTYLDTFTTPQSSSVRTKINIPLYDPGASGQILAFGLPSGANSTSRAISIFDNRSAGENQPAIALFNPNETSVFGLSWDGDNDDAYLKALGASNIHIRANSTNIANFMYTGRVGFGTSDPISAFELTRELTTHSATGKALAIFNQTENQDIFAASASGTTRFRIANNGQVAITGLTNCNTIDTDANGVLSCGTDAGDAMTNYWQFNNGAISPFTNTVDLLVGGTSTDSAKFAVLNVNNGTPTASVSAGTSGAAYLTAAGNLQTTANQSLSLGGSTTGNILLNSDGNNRVGIGTATPTQALDVNGNLALTGAARRIIGDFSSGTIADRTLFQTSLINGDTSVGIIPNGTGTAGYLSVFNSSNPDNASFISTRVNATRAVLTSASNGAASNLPLAFEVGFDNEVGRFDTNGRFGIGTTSTLATLDVRGNIGTLPVASFSGTTSRAGLIVDNNGVGDLFTASKSGATKFVINNAGNVGIGTSSPNSTLEVAGTIRASGTVGALRLNAQDNSGNFYTLYSAAGELTFYGGLNTRAIMTAGGRFALGTNNFSPAAQLDVKGDSGTIPVASFSGTTAQAGVIVDNNGVGDLFTASKSGATKFTILNNGNVRINNLANCDTIDTDANGVLSCGTDAGASSTNYWQLNNGAVSPFSNTADLLIGGTSTQSARFAFINSLTGTPTASISANSGNNAAFLTGAGVLGTTNAQTLTLGSSSTGNVVLSPGGNTALTALANGNVGIGTSNPGSNLEVVGAGSTTDPGAVAAFGSGGSTVAGNMYGIQIDKNGVESLFLGINKNSVTGSVPASSAYISTYMSNGTLSLGRGNSSGTLSTSDIFIDGTGEVGIGTTDPNALLQVGAFNRSSDSEIAIETQAASSSILSFRSAGTSVSEIYRPAGSTDLRIWGQAYGTDIASFNTSTGRVGIGTDNQLATLDVRGNIGTLPVASFSGTTARAGLIVDNNGVGDLFTASKSGATKFVVNNAGDVGIGIAMPTAELVNSGLRGSLASYGYIQAGGNGAGKAVLAPNYIGDSGSLTFYDSSGNNEGTLSNSGNGLELGANSSPYIALTGGFNGSTNVGINVTSSSTPRATLDVRGNIGTQPVASFSGTTARAGIIVDNNGVGDLFTASKSGATKFVVDNAGNVRIANLTTAGGILYTNGTGTIAQTSQGVAGQCLQSDGTNGAPVWGSCDGSSSVNSFTIANGLLYNSNLTTDFAIGGNSSASAKFKVSLSGTQPTASISATTSQPALLVDNTIGDLFTASKSGATKFVIKNSGTVGIGQFPNSTSATTPVGTLHLWGLGATGSEAVMYFGDRGQTGNPYIREGGSGDTDRLELGGRLGLVFATGSTGTERMRVDSNGNVLINTTSALATFDVRGISGTTAVASVSGQTSNAALIVDNSGVGDILAASSSGLNRFVIKQDGNVGIGTTNPSYKLDVAGTIRATDSLRADAGMTVTSLDGLGQLMNVSNFSMLGDTEYITDGEFRTDPNTNWDPKGSATLSSSGAGYNGTGVTISTTTAANDGIRQTFGSPLGASEYTLSFYAQMDDSSGTLTTLRAGYNDGSDTTCTLNSNTVVTTGMQFYRCTFTAASSINSIFIDQGAAGTARTIYIDSVTLGEGASPIYAQNDNGYFSFEGNFTNPLSLRGFYNSTTAFQVKTNADFNLFVADTTNRRIGVGTGLNPLLATMDVRGTSGTTPVASFSGTTAMAGLIVDNNGVGDLFVASKSGATKFAVLNNGDVRIANLTTAGGVLYTNGTGTIAQTAQGVAGQCLQSQGVGGAPTWGACDGAASVNAFTTTNGLIHNGNLTTDFAFGGATSESAKFKISISGTNPTASVSGSTSNAALMVDNAGVGDLFTASKSGATKFVIKNSGNVGIGTFDPGALLELRLPGADTGNIMRFGNTTNGIWGAYALSATAMQLNGGSNTGISLGSNNSTDRFVLDTNGRIGIGTGTNTTLATLDVRGQSGTLPVASVSGATSNAGLIIDNNGNGDIITASKSGKTFFTVKNNGVIQMGNSTNGITFDYLNGGPNYAGLARPSKQVVLSPEYTGGIITASGSATTDGDFTADASASASTSWITLNGQAQQYLTYYEWNSAETSLQDYTVAVRVTLPADFSSWAPGGSSIQVLYNTELTTSDSSKLDMFLYPSNSATPTVYRQAQTSSTAKAWRTLDVPATDLNDGTAWNEASRSAMLYFKMSSRNNNHVQLGDIILNYLSKF